MSGFLTRSKNGEEPPMGDDEESQKEQANLVLPALAQEFVHRDDFIRIIQQIVNILDPTGKYGINPYDDAGAQMRVAEIKGES